MVVLTEKEWTVEVNDQLTVKFFAELRNNVVSDIYAIIELDGFHVKWSPFHERGMIRVYEVGRLTNDWIRIQSLLGIFGFEEIESSLKEFLNENLTFNN